MTVTCILLPLEPTVPFARVVRQAVWLAGQCGARLILLRVGPPAWDIDDGVPEGVAVTRLAVGGDPVHQIAAIARAHNVDLIMLATHAKWRLGEGADGEQDFFAFLRHSVAGRTIDLAGCAVWVDTGQDSADAAVHRPLCYLDLRPRSAGILAQAGAFAAAVGAPLAVAHATFSTQIHAPGGASLTARMWQESFAETATATFEQLQRRAGTDASLLIENGEPLQVIPRLAARADADLLIAGHWPASERWKRGSPWNDDSDIFRIIRYARVPVLVLRTALPAATTQKTDSARRRFIANAIILLPLVLILVAAIVVGLGRTHPAHAPVTERTLTQPAR